ncbi:glycosyltransferase [Fulvivirgaceae bacterium BMA10]|uniref:Glycosyltransferase n=1 Tax=Splendidivirga corallicola TaxID=3051826 RepID=A0ABT8KV32_9BACT|nr:glycosyltransferase [Fulvivirgaceae bacterium BMA10]
MKKTKLVLASVLKPVDDTRMFEKFGVSSDQTNKYEINIIGFSSKNIPANENISFHPIFNFKRLSLKRLLAPWKYYILLFKLKPELIIVNTHELLIVSVLYKILFGVKLLYDVQENYWSNIVYTNTYVWPLKYLVAAKVRFVEWISSPFINTFFLAEKIYEREIPFLGKRYVTIQNKCRVLHDLQRTRAADNKIRLVYTGTISEHYGIFNAIRLTKILHQLDSRIELHIIGYCAKSSVLRQIKARLRDIDYIELSGGDHLVPHSDILQAVLNADFGLVPYEPNISTKNRFPTKIFEYLAYKLPMIIHHNPAWVDYGKQYNACISIDYHHIYGQEVFQKMLQTEFYQAVSPNDIHWESEEKKLLDTLENLI